MKEYIAQEISYGTDAVFHVVFDYDKADRLSVQGTMLTDLQRIQKGDVNFNEVLNLSVSLEIGSCFPSALPMGESKAWRIDERYPNRLVIEIPAEKQALGNVYAVIQFDVPSDKVGDGLFHQTRRIHLCEIVRSEQSQKVYRYPSSEHVLLLSQGEPSLPTSSFEYGRNLIVMSRMVQGDLMNRSNTGHEYASAHYDPIFTPVAPGDTFIFSCSESKVKETYTDGKNHFNNYGWHTIKSYVYFYNAKKLPIHRVEIETLRCYSNEAHNFYYNLRNNLRLQAPANAMYMRYSLCSMYQKVKLESIPLEGGIATEWSLSPEDKALGYVHPIDNLEV